MHFKLTPFSGTLSAALTVGKKLDFLLISAVEFAPHRLKEAEALWHLHSPI